MTTLLSINNYFYVRGGAEFVFLEHNQLLDEAGWQVVPFSMRHDNNQTSEWSGYFVDEIELSGDYGWLERLGKAGRAIYSVEARRKIGRLIDVVSPDLAHGHNIYHHISPSILIELSQRSIPTVLTLHDLKLACPSYRMMAGSSICEKCRGGRFYQAALTKCMHGSTALSAWVSIEAYLHQSILGSYKHVDRFIVPSRFYGQKFVEWGWPEEQFTYIPNFVDAESIEADYEPGDRFTFFGRLSGEKGIGTLIDAAAKAGVRLDIIGTGPDSDALKAKAESLGVDATFPGFVSGQALFDRIRAARAVVLPSEWYENAPISILEAFAAGKPVIGANIGGIPELITEDRGRSFEAFSSDSLASRLSEFASMPAADIAEMGQKSREYVTANHSRAVYLERCSSVYRELLS
jgi:glycosyltransferase involved in cell wall biosynthesis